MAINTTTETKIHDAILLITVAKLGVCVAENRRRSAHLKPLETAHPTRMIATATPTRGDASIVCVHNDFADSEISSSGGAVDRTRPLVDATSGKNSDITCEPYPFACDHNPLPSSIPFDGPTRQGIETWAPG
jgi:hypothetical protein